MPTVYIPQNVQRYDASRRCFKPVFDFTQATNFGRLHEVVDRSEDLLFIDSLTDKVKAGLSEFSSGDYLLAVGDPSLIAICAGVLFKKFHCVNMLKWDRQTSTYIKLEIYL